MNMTLNININFPEYFKNFIEGLLSSAVAENNHLCVNAPKLSDTKTNTATTAVIPVVAPTSIPVQAPMVAPTPAPIPQAPIASIAVPTAPPKSYTQNEVSVACAGLIAEGKQIEFNALLKSFNVSSASGIMQMPAEEQTQFIGKIREMGAKI